MRTARRTLLSAIVLCAIVLGTLAPAALAQRTAPPVVRHVPRHPSSLLDGCTPEQRSMIVTRISAAIDVGAPAYNDGDYLGCYRTYESTARAIEAALPNACSGPTRALREGRATALAATTDSARAWAMRDAFDGLIMVLIGRY
jgi:serine protease Do